ncbi:MAG: RimJ/RimL family protein N-acetyltransferase [Halocynthiibacter sp.]|jgi:RimJ/RimL family protein N-acetyltransferase
MTLITQVALPPVIETDRFVLRPLRASDAGLLSMYAGDERVARFTRSIPHPLPPGSTEAFITRVLAPGNPNQTWALDGSNSDLSEVLGVISLNPMERDQSEVGYWVAPAFWGTGLASGALRAIIETNPQNSKTLFAEVFQDNAASARVVKNNGFEYLGEAETFSVARNAIVPTWTYLRKIT